MSTKQTTPEQARQFHLAMTGSPDCFHDCCLCNLRKRIKQLENDFISFGRLGCCCGVITREDNKEWDRLQEKLEELINENR